MPSLSQMTRGIGRAKLERVTAPQPTDMPISNAPILPINPGCFTICPMPLVQAFPDDIRNFTRDGVAQQRVITPQ